MLRDILSQALKKEHRDAGLYLKEDEDFLYLKRGDEIKATFNSRRATIEEILKAADEEVKNA